MRRAVVALVLLAACGDDAPGIKIEDYSDQLRVARCERLTACGVYASQEACIAFLAVQTDPFVTDAVAAGAMRFAGDKVATCLSAITAQSCDETSQNARDIPAACAEVLVGALAEGESCAFDTECVSGSCSNGDCNRNTCCNGVCLAAIIDAAAGDMCAKDTDCADGLFCGTDLMCHPLGIARDMCSRDGECGYDLACIGATEMDLGRCRDLPAIGEACPYMRCAEVGATCANGMCVARGQEGSPCATPLDCFADAQCNNSICDALPKLGEPCIDFCTDKAWCNAGVCVAPQEDNAPCLSDLECTSTLCEEGPISDYCTQPAICI